MQLSFEWDEDKARENLKKHKIRFEEARTVFTDPFSITIADPGHSMDELRYIDIGTSDKNRVLVVVYTERGSKIRLIIEFRISNETHAISKVSQMHKCTTTTKTVNETDDVSCLPTSH
jgi:uncharacterized DUF497 family protein